MYLIYLDDYHLDDLLYMPSLAQQMGRMRHARPACLFVHGSGEQADRLLEAEGLFPEREGGVVQARTPEEAALVERARRQVNRRVVGALTEEGVHAVGFQGADRGLLKVDDEGTVTTGRATWLKDLVEKRAVPVVSARAQRTAAAARAVPVPAATVALVRALGEADLVVVFFTRTNEPGIIEAERPLSNLPLDALPDAIVPDSEAVHTVVTADIPVLLTSVRGLFSADEPQGTRIFNVKTAKKG